MTDLVNGDRYTGGSSSIPAVSGYPEHHGADGIANVTDFRSACRSLAARGARPVLIKLAYAFEQTTKARKAPRFLSTASLTCFFCWRNMF